MLDEENPGPSQIVFQDKEREGQGLHAQETSIPSTVVGDSEHENNPTSDACGNCNQYPCGTPCLSLLEDGTGDTGEGEGGPTEALEGACRYHRVIRFPANSPQSRIQNARMQCLRMQKPPSMFQKSSQRDSVLSKTS